MGFARENKKLIAALSSPYFSLLPFGSAQSLPLATGLVNPVEKTHSIELNLFTHAKSNSLPSP